MVYGRLWYVSRSNYWSVRFKNQMTLRDSIKLLETTKKEKGTYSWSCWNLESSRFSDFPKGSRKFAKNGQFCSVPEDLIQYINRIHQFWRSYS